MCEGLGCGARRGCWEAGRSASSAVDMRRPIRVLRSDNRGRCNKQQETDMRAMFQKRDLRYERSVSPHPKLLSSSGIVASGPRAAAILVAPRPRRLLQTTNTSIQTPESTR
jgi:hypothetical protein